MLLLGPLYHLPEAGDRRPALAEARRVLRPGGVLAVAAISRFASTIDGLLKRYVDEPVFERTIERVLEDGRHVNPARHPGWFTTAYFHLPDELGAEVGDAGFELAALLAVEGVGAWVPDVDDWLDDRAAARRCCARSPASRPSRACSAPARTCSPSA